MSVVLFFEIRTQLISVDTILKFSQNSCRFECYYLYRCSISIRMSHLCYQYNIVNTKMHDIIHLICTSLFATSQTHIWRSTHLYILILRFDVKLSCIRSCAKIIFKRIKSAKYSFFNIYCSKSLQLFNAWVRT